jgi:hypothetical protein
MIETQKPSSGNSFCSPMKTREEKGDLNDCNLDAGMLSSSSIQGNKGYHASLHMKKRPTKKEKMDNHSLSIFCEKKYPGIANARTG